MPFGIAAAGIGAAGAIGGALIGSQKSGGSSSSGTSQAPAWQQQYQQVGLLNDFNNFVSRANTPLPAGPWTTPENDQQRYATDQLYHTGTDAPGNFAPWTAAGTTLASGAAPFLNNAAGIASNGIGARDQSMTDLLKSYAMTGAMPGTSGVNNGLVGGVTGAATNGLSSLGQGQSVANQVAGTALNPQNGMNAVVNGATQFANNAGLDAQIDAANRDTTRDLTENTLRGIDQGAMLTGNANSSRAGALDAIATRGAADREADTAAAMRGQAYNTGGQLAGNLYASGLNTALGAGSALTTNAGVAGGLATSELSREQNQNQFGTSTQLGAANSANSSDLGYNTANTAAQLSANAQIGAGLNTGITASNAGLAGSLAGLTAAQGAGTFTQQQDQAQLTDSLNRWNAQDQRTQSLLQQYWQMAGAGLGTSSTQTTQPNNGGIGGAMSGALGGGLAAYRAYQDYQNNPNTVATANNTAGLNSWGSEAPVLGNYTGPGYVNTTSTF